MSEKYTSTQVVDAVHIEKKGTYTLFGTKLEVREDDSYVFQAENKGHVYVQEGERFRSEFQKGKVLWIDEETLRTNVKVFCKDSEMFERYCEIQVLGLSVWAKSGNKEDVQAAAEVFATNLRDTLVAAAKRSLS